MDQDIYQELANREPFERLQHREAALRKAVEKIKDEVNRGLLDDDRESLRHIRSIIFILVRILDNLDTLGTATFDLQDAVLDEPYWKEIIKPIIEFSPHWVERGVMAADLLEYFAGTLAQPIRSKYMHVSIHQRKEFLDAIGYPSDDCR